METEIRNCLTEFYILQENYDAAKEQCLKVLDIEKTTGYLGKRKCIALFGKIIYNLGQNERSQRFSTKCYYSSSQHSRS